MSSNRPEVWLRGPVPGITPALQPVAHALMQAKEEVEILMADFPDTLLWNRPAGVASVAFHLQHLRGVLERLFTYAKGEMLTTEQLAQLQQEGVETNASTKMLTAAFLEQVHISLSYLTHVDKQTLFEPRLVGRGKLPSTVFGLLVHAAEHTMRHLGQLLVTVRILRDRTE